MKNEPLTFAPRSDDDQKARPAPGRRGQVVKLQARKPAKAARQKTARIPAPEHLQNELYRALIRNPDFTADQARRVIAILREGREGDE